MKRTFGYMGRLAIAAVLAAGVVVVQIADSRSAGAEGFDLVIKEFRVTGNLEFFDDFEDGSRDTPPTSELMDLSPSRTVEFGGALHLAHRYGYVDRPDLGQDHAWIEGGVDLGPIPDPGTGTTTVTARMLPSVLPSFDYDPLLGMATHYILALCDPILTCHELWLAAFLFQVEPGQLHMAWRDGRCDYSATPCLAGIDVFSEADITGDLVFEIVIDHATGTMLPRYSRDGGLTFVEPSAWGVPATPLPTSDGDVATFWIPGIGAFGRKPTAKEVSIDIKPGSCPNSCNRSSKGVLPVAILGSAEFDVTQIDLASVLISRADGMGDSIGPHEGPPGPHTTMEDVGTPYEGDTCGCHEATGDGYADLSMKFKTQDVVAALDLDTEDSGALVELVVAGTLMDGTVFEGSDCVRLVPPGTPPGLARIQSNTKNAWIEASPLDTQLDGGGFGDFERTYPQSTEVTLAASARHAGRSFRGWRIDGGELVEEATLSLPITSEEHVVEAEYGPRSGCGLGFELALAVPALLLPLLWRRRRSDA